MKALLMLLLGLSSALTLSACNTVEGVGQDVEAAGDAIGDLARDVEDEIED